MNILVIAADIGITAQGIVYETLIRELSKSANITLITGSIRKGLDLKLPICVIPSMHESNYRIENLLFSVFKRNFLDDLWLWKNTNKISKELVQKHHIILSFISNHHYRAMLLADYLSQRDSIKWSLYSVDAIPAPIGWSKKSRFVHNTKSFIGSYIKKSPSFFSSNYQMLAYQLFGLDYDGKTGVIYTPVRDVIRVDECKTEKSPIFLYTGGIYGPRRPEALFEGFRLFLKKYPEAKLMFVGTSEYVLSKCEDLVELKKVELYKHTHDLAPYYKKSTALLDINAYFENDVFLSSKVVNYLGVRRPIISITGLNSPSRNIFTNDPTIIHCKHDANEICDALCFTYEKQHWDWKERENYISLFSPENVIKEMLEVIK